LNPGSSRHQPDHRYRTFEQAQHDLVIEDEHGTEVPDAIVSTCELGYDRFDATIKLVQVFLAYARPETLRDVTGPNRA